MISRPASDAADSSVCPAKNTSAVSIMTKVSARNGAATSANSMAAAPSCWRARAQGKGSIGNQPSNALEHGNLRDR
jgi:hypothetical protein